MFCPHIEHFQVLKDSSTCFTFVILNMQQNCENYLEWLGIGEKNPKTPQKMSAHWILEKQDFKGCPGHIQSIHKDFMRTGLFLRIQHSSWFWHICCQYRFYAVHLHTDWPHFTTAYHLPLTLFLARKKYLICNLRWFCVIPTNCIKKFSFHKNCETMWNC